MRTRERLIEGDDESLRAAVGVLERLRCGDVVPSVAMIDAPGSRFNHGAFGMPGWIGVSRAAAAAGPGVLAGEVAHEYAHLLDPQDRRDGLRARLTWAAYWLWLGVDFVVVSPRLTGWIGGGAGLIVGQALVWVPIVATLVITTRLSHRREFRADLGAAVLLGATEPVLAMLERIDRVLSGWPRRRRLLERLSHPSPQRRLNAIKELASWDELRDAGETENAPLR